MNEAKNAIRGIVVFCGSNFGRSAAYRDAAEALGIEIARRGWRLIYGGTNKGLMGVVADAVLEAGGEVYGVITHALHARGHRHRGVASYEIVDDMRIRKARMFELGDAFVALPGGYGTLEELLEVATLAQLGTHAKPLGLLDVGAFYQALRSFLGHAVSEGFMKREHADMLISETHPAELLDALLDWKAPKVTKWIGQENA